MAEDDEGAEFDAERAASLVGKSVLVGLTYLDANGDVVSRVQFFGQITSFDPEMVTISRNSKKDFTLPPALQAFEEAEPGEYTLHTTGEVVVDPDLISTWTIRAPSDDDRHSDQSGGI